MKLPFPRLNPCQASPDFFRGTQAHQTLPACFRIGVWNLHKEGPFHWQNFHYAIPKLTHTPIHLWTFQEARFPIQSSPPEPHSNYTMACNLQTKHHQFGVLTTSDYPIKNQQRFLSRNKELGFLTHKSALLTQHPLADGRTLTVLNLHAMIFVPFFLFKREWQRLQKWITQDNSPFIISGDFNTWSQKRTTWIHQQLLALGFTKAEVMAEKHIKQVRKHPLDHLYYRGLTLQWAQAFNVPTLSDHNPIIAEFCL